MITFHLKKSRGLALLLGLLLLPMAVLPTATYAADKEEEKPPVHDIDPATGEILTRAIEALNADQFDAAAQIVRELKMDKLSPYEKGRVEQILATIANAQEDYPGAQAHLQAAVASGGLNESEISQARYQIAQLWMAQEKWKEGAAAMEEWIATALKPNSSAYYLLAVAYYQQDLFSQALPPAQKAVELAEKPQESWIQLVLALHLQQENWNEAVPLLMRLIDLYPDKKTYWVQLSSVYGQMDDFAKSLAVMQLAYSAGLIVDEGEVRRLFDLLLFNNVPYRCATLIDEALEKKLVKSDEKLYQKKADCLIAAREYEKAIGPLRRTAELSQSGDSFVRLGEAHIQLNQWEKAANEFRHALNKGGLKDTAYAQLMLGIAYYNQKELSQAADWLQKAKSSSKQRKTAEGYLQLIRAQSS
jgi:tetratricopeptide (TPR) repeat protein